MIAKVMLSSTSLDLPEHRRQAIEACQRVGMQPIAMETLPASQDDAVSASIAMVDQADIYVGILGFRYGHVPPGADRSITHLEYARAQARGIPTLMFLMSSRHPVTRDDVEVGSGAERLEAWKEQIKLTQVVAPFYSPEDLRGHLIAALEEQRRRRDGAGPSAGETIHFVASIPPRPEPYVAHPYSLLQTTDLIGRRRELSALTDWFTSSTPDGARVFALVAIGGMGKSALTWKWFRDIAPQEREDLDGRIWWSFYESDASYEAFVTRALAYTNGVSEMELCKLPLHKRENMLWQALDGGRYLVVLDGLERMLVAYARMDAAFLRDDDLDEQTDNHLVTDAGLPTSEGGAGRRHHLRRTAELSAGRFLNRLRLVRGSKILISTRLFPADLQSPTGLLAPGVAACALTGLTEEDALELWRAYRARGSRAMMAPYFRSFDNHPLLIQVLASEVAGDREARGDFDAWRKARPDFDPFSLPIIQAQSHVLQHALVPAV